MQNYRIKRKKGLVLFVFYVMTICISLSQSIPYAHPYQSISEDPDPYLKIDENLLALIQTGDPNEKIDIIIIFTDGFSDYLSVENISILQKYDIINGVLASAKIGNILEIASHSFIKSIWTDTQSLSSSNSIDVSEFLRSASSNINPNIANYNEEIGAEDLHNQGYNGSDIIIAVLDTGVDITGAAGGDLDDFDENTETADPKYLGGVSMVPEEPLYYSDLNGRGTFHAGIACGTGNLNKSYIGVAPGAYYLNVKIYDSIGITYWSFIISGIEWAIDHGADILLFAQTIPGLYLDPVCMALNNAVDRGVLVVSPVGDDGPGYMSINTPGQAQKVLKVGAYDSFTGEVANFSSRGPAYDFSLGPNVIAPGVDVVGPRSRIFTAESLDMLSSMGDIASEFGLSFDFSLDLDLGTLTDAIPSTVYGEEVLNEPNYTRSSGTGAAAAVVAGAAAILMGAYPLATPILISQALIETARPVTINPETLEYDPDVNAEGAGLINVSAAFSWLGEIFTANEYDIVPLALPLIYPGIITSSDYQNMSSYSNFLGNDLLEYDLTALLSSQVMMDAVVIMNSSQPDAMNMTSIHLPLNQFGLSYRIGDSENTNFHWFSEFQVIREMHQMVNSLVYQEGYKRYASILEIDSMYVAVIAETWSYAGEYGNETFTINVTNPYYNFSLPGEYSAMNITDRVNAIKFNFHLINDRDDHQAFEDVNLFSYFKADLYLNETGIASEYGANQLDSALNFSYDDTVRYNETNQMIWVEDMNNNTDFASGDKFTAMGFQSSTHQVSKYALGDSIGLLLNITLDNEEAMDWNTTTNQFLSFNASNSSSNMVDPGFASVYSLSSIPYGSKQTFSGVLGLGQKDSMENAREVCAHQIYLASENVTNYNVTDLMVMESKFDRIGQISQDYFSTVKIINLGTETVIKSDLAFAVNRSNAEDELDVLGKAFTVRNLEPMEIREYSASWFPLDVGVYNVGWVFGEIDDLYAIQSEANILSNSLARTVFIIDGSYYEDLQYDYFTVFPQKLDQNPMKIYAPLDFGLYNLTVYSIAPMQDVTISAEGLGSNMVIFLDAMNISLTDSINTSGMPSSAQLGGISTDINMGGGSDMAAFGDLSNMSIDLPSSLTTDLEPYSPIFLILLANPLSPPGDISFDITFTAEGEEDPFYSLPVELEIYPNRGRIWFDATHLNVFVSDNLVGGGLSGITNGNLNLSLDNADTFGGFGEDISLDAADGFDITRFLDLNERLDTTWGSFFNLRELWAEPSSNNGKGASLYTIIPFIELNVLEMTGFNLTSLRLDELISDTSFLGNTLGNYYFESNTISTNTINHDVLQFFDGLVINDPEQAFLPQEIENITSWVDAGGTLYVWAEDMYHNNIPSLNELLEPFSLKLANTSFFPYSDFGDYSVDLNPEDYVYSIFKDSGIDSLTFKNPVEVQALNSSAKILCKGTFDKGVVGISYYGKGRVIVVGDNDIFKEILLSESDNEIFAQRVLSWGQENYYQCDIVSTPNAIALYEQGFVDLNITNYAEAEEKGMLSKGLIFVSAFFYENGSMINAELYGIQLPALPMFHTDASHYMTYVNSEWYLVPGNYYVMILIDHPAAVSELFYVKFSVSYADPPPAVEGYVRNEPAYPHYVDVAAVLAITIMLLTTWGYNLDKYRKRLQIVPLKGNYLNIATTRLSEGRTLIKLLLRGLEKGDVEEIERIRYLLSNTERLKKYLKELKKFGESIGEHY